MCCVPDESRCLSKCLCLVLASRSLRSIDSGFDLASGLINVCTCLLKSCVLLGCVCLGRQASRHIMCVSDFMNGIMF